jgi:hypothetical protein
MKELQTLFDTEHLAVMFDMQQKSVTYKIRHVEPDATRLGKKLYKVHRVMQYLVEPDEEKIMQKVMKLTPNKMPPRMTSAYWSAKRAQQEYELRDGQLWETVVVQQKITQLFMLIRQHIRMLVDVVERRTELTGVQREIISNSMDGLLKDLQLSITENFSHKEKFEMEDVFS